MSRKAHADFQNCLPDNKLVRDRVFSVRGLVTHDWRNVGDGIRSRAGDIFTNPQCDKDADFIFAFVCAWSSGEDCPFFILDGMAKSNGQYGRHAAKTRHKGGITASYEKLYNCSTTQYSIFSLCNKCGGTRDMAFTVILKDGPI